MKRRANHESIERCGRPLPGDEPEETGIRTNRVQFQFELEGLKTAMKAEMEATQAAIKSYMTEAQG